jgi:hypothetical protein
MAEYITSQEATVGKHGELYVPQCIRSMINCELHASLEEHAAGRCLVLRTEYSPLIESARVEIRQDGYMQIRELYTRAGLKPPFRWQAIAQLPGNTLDCLILWQMGNLELPKNKRKEFAGFLRKGLFGKKKTI